MAEFISIVPRIAILVLALALLSPAHFTPANAAPDASGQIAGQKRVALVIGNSDYEHVTRLPNPANDADDMAVVLETLGFAVNHVANVSRAVLEEAVADFADRAVGADIALVFYAGHGIEVDRRNYLIPVDAQLANDRRLRFEAVALDDVMASLDAVGGVRIVLLDACRNNPFSAAMAMSSPNRSVGRGLSRIEAPGGTLISYAAKEGTVAADGDGRNSPFTAALLDRLSTPGVEVSLLFRQVRDSVLAATGGQQEPYVSASLPGEPIYFVPPASLAPTPGAQQQLAAPSPQAAAAEAWVLVKDSQDANYLKAFIDSFPDTFYGRLAANRLKALEEQRVAVGIFPAEPTPQASPNRSFKPGDEFEDCDVCPKMVVLPAGSFTMGSPPNEADREEDEGPRHRVTIGAPFAAGKFEVTFAEWDACVSDGGCDGYWPDDRGWGRSDRPVVNVSWADAKAYVQWLSDKTGNEEYRLLSEAEWEYAARAGTTTPFSTGRTITTDQANFDGNYTYGGSGKGQSRARPVAVGAFGANAFGLHDMHGNVWEWVEDCWNDNYAGAPRDGTVRTAGDCSQRVLRGGSWFIRPRSLRSANRVRLSAGVRDFDYGFRVARTLIP